MIYKHKKWKTQTKIVQSHSPSAAHIFCKHDNDELEVVCTVNISDNTSHLHPALRIHNFISMNPTNLYYTNHQVYKQTNKQTQVTANLLLCHNKFEPTTLPNHVRSSFSICKVICYTNFYVIFLNLQSNKKVFCAVQLVTTLEKGHWKNLALNFMERHSFIFKVR